MLLAACLILFSTALPAQLFLLYPTQQFQFVDTGGTAQISCASTEKIEDNGLSFSWYKGREHGMPVLIKSCSDNQTAGKFACKAKGQRATLKISNVQTSDSGLYFCAQIFSSSLYFSNGSTSLIIGDSYTPSTWVKLLQPFAQDPPARFENQHACVVHGVSSLVQVSWDVPGDLRHEARTLLVKNSSGSLTFISLLHGPLDSPISGENVTCEVRFNSSGPSVKKSAVFNAHLTLPLCHLSYTVLLDILALLVLPLNFLWIRFYPSGS
ncbi:uncharacterized protein LOC133375060 isoform X2 [Rhineura floridana]|uniref:uncharacterized protein LOC133375060 isoform X2 n=1 Tax=Rhineura floridana TaxID=261503 RepID=UPI002AC80D85|nr:uncharacterized protein LOC133375060 isoform X2 [Rhineura floridana]